MTTPSRSKMARQDAGVGMDTGEGNRRSPERNRRRSKGGGG